MAFVEDGDMLVHKGALKICGCMCVCIIMFMFERERWRSGLRRCVCGDGGGGCGGGVLLLKRRKHSQKHSRPKNRRQSLRPCVFMHATHRSPTVAYVHKTKSPD